MSLVLTLLQPLRKKYATGGFDKFEQRRSRYGVWDFYQRQSSGTSSLIDDDLRGKIKRSMGNTIQVPVLDTQDVVISNVRSCTIPDSENVSKIITLTFVTYSFGFTMIPAQHFNNEIGYQQDFDKKMEKYLQKYALTLDTAAANHLNVNRNQYFPAEITNYYPVVGNALQVTDAEKDDFYNNASAIMQTMDFYGGTNVIASTTAMPMINRLKAQGAGNSVNQDFQFNGYEWTFSNRITSGAGVRSTAFLVPDGVVGVENRNDPDAIAKSRVGTQKIWDEVTLPLVNQRVASYYYEDCADKSALHAGTGALTRTKLEGYEFSTDVCFVAAYNSSPSTRYTPIIKAEVSAA